MGFEYELRFTHAGEKYCTFAPGREPSPATIDAILKSAPSYHAKNGELYEYRTNTTDSARMPRAYATIEPFGIYLCLNDSPANESHELFNYLIHCILSEYTGLEIVEI